MNQVPDLNFNDEAEFRKYLTKLQWDNPTLDTAQLMNILVDNWATIWWQWIDVYADSNKWWETEIQQYVHDRIQNWPDFTEAANSDDWWMKTGQEKLDTLVSTYNAILEKTRQLVDDKNSWYWLTGEWAKAFNDELNWYKEQLRAIEQSPEFEQLMVDLAEGWTGRLLWDNWILSANDNQTLRLIASWKWSQMFEDKNRRKNWKDSFSTTWFAKFLKELSRPAWVLWWVAWSIFWWEDAQDIAKEYLKNKWNKKTDTSKKEEEWWMSYIWDDSVTDEMKFGDDVESQRYVDWRDTTLAMHLSEKWITSKKDIDKYLSKYPSWQNAKQEWKDNTLANLENKVKELTPKKEEKKSNEKLEWVWKPDYNKKIFDFKPDNDSPLNWEEDDNIYVETMYDENGNPVWSKRSDAFLYDEKWNAIWLKKSDKYLYNEKTGMPNWSKATQKKEDNTKKDDTKNTQNETKSNSKTNKNTDKKSNKKEAKKPLIAKSSSTIRNLLKRKA